jgi:hypothetical protein
VPGGANERTNEISLIALITLLVGAGLFVAAFRRFKQAPAQAMGMILGALLINSWWIAIAEMAFYKFVILKQDT